MRPSGREPNQLRQITLETGVNKHAEGSCLARFGDTHVLCTATVEKRLPAPPRIVNQLVRNHEHSRLRITSDTPTVFTAST